MKTRHSLASAYSTFVPSVSAPVVPKSSALFLSVLATFALLATLHETQAAALVQNGSFASPGTSGQLTVSTNLTSWTGGGKEGTFGSQTTPPVFVFTLGTTAQLSSNGVNGDAFMGNVKFYGATAAPGGGVVLAAAGDPDWIGSISQTINGLNVGTNYLLTFNWAGAQQQGFSGNTTEKWQVSLGSDTLSTSILNTPSQTFVGWQTGSMNFTATASSEVLKFQAVGTPSGEQPWLLLNNVQMNVVPEPNSMLILGVGGLISAGRWRRKSHRAGV